MKILDLDDIYEKCESSGFIREKNQTDIHLIRSLKKVSEEGLKFIKDKTVYIDQESTGWTFVFRDYYESLRGLIEAFLLFDNIEADSHQCKNAYICTKYPELGLSWNFLESIRLKRNRINYRGELITYQEWKKLEKQFEEHINIIKKEIEKKLKS